MRSSKSPSFTSNTRPPKDKRAFISKTVDEYIELTASKITNPQIATIFTNCYPNTLDTTVFFNEQDEDTFIITGDIEAMWLRDSSFQVYPYLRHCNKDSHLNQMIKCLFRRQMKSILIDPYANAFNKDELKSPWYDDLTYNRVNGKKEKAMTLALWERKFELDSLLSPFFIQYHYYLETSDTSFIDDDWFKAVELVIKVIKLEQRGTDEEDSQGGEEYSFQRITNEPFESLHQGRGNPCKTCGLVKCGFRNSDDTCLFSFNIPENAMAASVLYYIAQLIQELIDQSNGNLSENNNIEFAMAFEKELIELSNIIKASIYEHAIIIDRKTNEQYFAYEVDGYGNYYFMDDPGYPSLLSLPFLGFVTEDNTIYLNTRKRILSSSNPYYIKGEHGEGLASSHSYRRYIWPLRTLMQGITSTCEAEVKHCLEIIIESAKSTGYMHESYDIDNPEKFTRPWFAWANSFFGVMIEVIVEKYPNLLK